MTKLYSLALFVAALVPTSLPTTNGAEPDPPELKTGLLGGVNIVTPVELTAMQNGQYVLRARDRMLSKVPAEKAALPHDPEGHVQAISVFRAPDGAIYVKQQTILCKSTDGGRTWSSWNYAESEKTAMWQIRSDGNWISVGGDRWGKTHEPLPVRVSQDEGRTWTEIANIPLPEQYDERHGYSHFRSKQGVLIVGFACNDHLRQNGFTHKSGIVTLNLFHSRDDGVTWDGPHKVSDWCYEGGLVETASGKMLAILRYQRALMATDPPDMLKRWDLQRYDGSDLKFPYKHIFLADSTDGGKTWAKLRQLTTVHGQCYGYPAALEDGTVVIVHDSRYGPGVPSGRAMISRDEGQTWQDEAYYLYYGRSVSGYSQSIAVDDDTILTVAGTCERPEAKQSWNAALGHSKLTAIRWKPAAPQKEIDVDPAAAKQARRKALARRRRVIFNDDTYELDRADANTPEGYLSRRLAPLAGTHVDVISWSVLGGWADAPVYDSKVQPIYGDAHGDITPYWKSVTKNVKQLIKAGRGPLQVVIDFAHENDMELFASVRMNDSHDSFIPGGVTLWKKEHPEFLVDSTGIPNNRDEHPLGLYVIAQDFTHQEVRDRKFEIIEEVARRYDVDGIELNYIRHPVFFSRTMRGQPVTDDEVEIMTSFMRRVRALTDEVGARRNRPLLVTAVVPDSLAQAKDIGLDIETWVENDLVDILTPGLGYAPFTLPVKQYVDLAAEHGIKVYPCINRKAPQHVEEKYVPEGFRGVATNWYRAGADGIYYWNLGTPIENKSGQELLTIRNRYYAALPEIGDAAAMVDKDKLFCVDDPVLSYYTHISSHPPLPVELHESNANRVPLVVGDDLQAADKAGRLVKLVLMIKVKGPVGIDTLALRFNGHAVRGGTVVGTDANDQETRIDYPLSAALIKQGQNIVEATLTGATEPSDETSFLATVRLLVRYKR